MKKKLRLYVVLRLKEDLETMISASYHDIQKYNTAGMAVGNLLDNVGRMEEQLIVFKEAIQNANRRRHVTGRTNNYYIYKYSNLLARKRMYQRIKTVKDPDNRLISPDIARIEIKKLDAELQNISNKLSNFNKRRQITIEIDESLNLKL